MSKRIMITGACGFIGSHVVDLLAEQGHEIIAVDNLSSGKRKNLPKPLVLNPYDVRHKANLEFVFANHLPEIVIHLAAQPSLLASMDDPIHDAKVNIIGTLNLIELAKKYDVRRFVFASTSAAEPGWSWYFTESRIPEPPTSAYGISKLAAEHYIMTLTRGFTSIVLRFGNVYGPRQVPLGENQLIPRALDHIYRGKEFFIHGDGSATRDYIYVKDVAEAVVLAAIHRYDRGGLFNICTGKSNQTINIVEFLAEITDFRKKWKHALHDNAGRYMPWRVEMSPELFMQEFEWKPRHSLKEGLIQTAAWYKEEYEIN